jgi:hypothetical protein
MLASNGKLAAEADKVIKFLRDEMGVKKIRFPEHCGIGVKPCSEEGHKASGSSGDRVRDHQRPRLCDAGS